MNRRRRSRSNNHSNPSKSNPIPYGGSGLFVLSGSFRRQRPRAGTAFCLPGSLLISYDSNIGRSVVPGPFPIAASLPWDGGLQVGGGRSHSLPPVPRRHYVKKMVGTRQTENGQGPAKRRFPSLVNFVFSIAYHFNLALPAAFTQPGNNHLAELCNFLFAGDA